MPRVDVLLLMSALLCGCVRSSTALAPWPEMSEPRPEAEREEPNAATLIRWEHHDNGLYAPYTSKYPEPQDFTVSLARDGELRWLGVRGVRTLGERATRVDPEAVAAIFAEVDGLDEAHLREPQSGFYCTKHSYSIRDHVVLERGAEAPAVEFGLCHAYPTHARLEATVECLRSHVHRWIDPDYVVCRVARTQRYHFTSESAFVNRRAVLHDVNDDLRASRRRRATLYVGTSLREDAAARRARTQETLDELASLGGDVERVEVINVGQELARWPADDERAGEDEWIYFEVVDVGCLDRQRSRDPSSWARVSVTSLGCTPSVED